MGRPTATDDDTPAPRTGRGYTAGFLSSARVSSQPVGLHLRPGELGGYYSDLTIKAETPGWPPTWLRPPAEEPFIYTAQWGLGAYDRYLAGDGDVWLASALDCAGHLVERQAEDGALRGAWVHGYVLAHTYRVNPPWVSGMAQGECASLLVRAYAETGEQRYAEAALLAMRPLALPLDHGGVRADLGSGFLLEEYPTDPPSHVLNGAMFALWGYYDVALGLGDAEARREFDAGVATLAENLHRWDTGSWSRYDLFPFAITNVASSFYHLLHIDQLRAMQLIAPRRGFAAAIERFERYRDSRWKRLGSFVRKGAFRVLVPRNTLLAQRTPFRRPWGQA